MATGDRGMAMGVSGRTVGAAARRMVAKFRAADAVALASIHAFIQEGLDN